MTTLGETYHNWLVVNSNLDDTGECLVWPFPKPGKYPIYYLLGANRSAHREMCELANGPPPFVGAMALHSCGNAKAGCVHPKHLRWGTHQDNMDDKAAHGTGSRGTAHGKAKLDDASVRRIRALRAEGLTMKSIGSEFGVTRQAVRQIVTRQTWRHVA